MRTILAAWTIMCSTATLTTIAMYVGEKMPHRQVRINIDFDAPRYTGELAHLIALPRSAGPAR